ncbi:hypothetical protein ACLI4R_14435 [Natrialbaceae archaeon A-chndr2]
MPTDNPKSDTDSVSMFTLLGGPIDDDVFFELMKNPQRRFIFQYLLAEKETKLVALAKEITTHEHGCQVDDLEEADWRQVYVALSQTHLPKMDQAGLLEYNSEYGVICLDETSVAMKDVLNQSGLID